MTTTKVPDAKLRSDSSALPRGVVRRRVMEASDLCDELDSIRARIVKSGQPLMSLESIERERDALREGLRGDKDVP